MFKSLPDRLNYPLHWHRLDRSGSEIDRAADRWQWRLPTRAGKSN